MKPDDAAKARETTAERQATEDRDPPLPGYIGELAAELRKTGCEGCRHLPADEAGIVPVTAQSGDADHRALPDHSRWPVSSISARWAKTGVRGLFRGIRRR